VSGTANPAWSLLGLGCAEGSEGEGPYNPIEYHNGTVWPADNSFVAAGYAPRPTAAKKTKTTVVTARTP
jgi:hypothetical protein